MSRSFYIVVVGCGRLGSQVAGELSRRGHSVVVIDSDEAAFGQLPAEYGGFTLAGDATEHNLLSRAKAGEADMLLATTGDDNVNLMVSQVAKRLFRVPRVIARVFEPRRGAVYERLGISTVCPTVMAAESLLESVREDLPDNQREPS
ncbi:MAG: TrkA family potassium uptake protein [Candidatus Brocadiia bacterium]